MHIKFIVMEEFHDVSQIIIPYTLNSYSADVYYISTKLEEKEQTENL